MSKNFFWSEESFYLFAALLFRTFVPRIKWRECKFIFEVDWSILREITNLENERFLNLFKKFNYKFSIYLGNEYKFENYFGDIYIWIPDGYLKLKKRILWISNSLSYPHEY